MKRVRSRSRSPIRRGGDDRRFGGGGGGRDRNRGSFNQHNDRMVYFSNLPYEMSWMELKGLVREHIGEVNFIETIDGRDGRPTGCAIVEFKTRDCVTKCLDTLHRREIRGRNIIAKEIRDPHIFFRKIREETGVDFLGNRDRHASPVRNFPRRAIATVNDDDTYGLSMAFLDQLNIKLPLVDRVFITNISFACGVGRLFDIFSLAGKVTWLDLQMDADGKSKGMAIVQYSHPIEAVQAISMLNGQRIYDRTISVKMDRYEKKDDRRDGELPTGLRGIGMGLGANGAPLADVASVISSISNANPAAAASAVIPQAGASLSLLNSQLTNPFGVAAANPAVIAPAAAASYGLQQSSIISPYATAGSGGSDLSLGAMGAGNGLYGGAGGSTKSSYYNSTIAPTSAGIFGGKATSVNGTAFTGNGPSSMMGRSAVSDSHFASSAVPYEQSSRIILIKNLPMDYTWQIVSDRVQQFGDLESVEMVSPGVAKVRFLQIIDAERAKQTLQGTTVEGRIIGIEYL